MKTFEIRVPVLDTVVYEIEAHSKKEALMLYYSGSDKLIDLGMVGGCTGKLEIKQIKKKKEKEEHE